ncbi:DNA topoisomerase 2 [Lobaria immixta]|nr:DNA topoisomerase 2 [Lobaria immixta]
MDSSVAESVLDDGGDSDAFSPEPIAKPKAKPKAAPKAAPKKAATVKATSKKTSQTTVKPKPKLVKSKKRPKPDSEDEDSSTERVSQHDDSVLSATPPEAKKQKRAPASKKTGTKPLREVENEALNLDGTTDAPPKNASKSTDQYQKASTSCMEMREVSFVPGLYKIFDEILVNAADNKQRDKNMETIKVTVDREKGEISVFNDGRGIPIEIHEAKKIWIPEMIFGHLLTSSNYDDDQEKVTGGRNGFGAKLCNIFSTKFTLETADSKTKKKYTQTWTKNMSEMGDASIVTNKSDDFTRITFTPDFKKFKMSGIDDDFEALVKRRVYDLAGTTRGVKVWLNGDRIKINSFKKYMEMYTKAIKRERGDEAINDTSDIVTDNPDVRWEVGFAVSDGTFQQVSFVNSIATTSGGTHVNYIADQVCAKLADIVKKKNKGGAALKLNQIRNHIFLFVNCLIVNPSFTSQTKEQLTTKHTQFGSKCTVSDEFLKKIAKTDVVTNILHFAQTKADQILKKSDGGKRSRMDNPKLTDANKAGTKDGYKCTLILTEGDSANGLAVAGRSVISADLFGTFPLRGKLLNVRDAGVDQISKNAEIQNIKNFLGLKHKTDYKDCKSLRYGHLMIMTDQDHDGSHIKGLLINFLQVSFPSLLKIPEFLVEFITPIVKVFKGNPKHPTKSHSFFTMPEYESWKEAHKHERGWEQKYYKGLGTSTTEDAEIYFRDLDKHLKEFHVMQDNEAELIELAFSKKKADERKEWLRQFKPGTFLDHSTREITYTDFINKELILFSMADNLRSIPSVVDGLKPGQRKVMYATFKLNLKKDMKVGELASKVSGLTDYHHGDASLHGTIVGLAQTFVGSNNVNCLEPSGNFGSRLQGGSDTASARYIFTRLSPFARLLFHSADEPILTYNTSEEHTIEPEVYVPVVPMILLNGADGIGTGWSSSIPNYNPEDIVDNLRRMMKGEEMKPMTPWFRDFKGTVTQVAPDRYKFSGIIKQTGDTEVEITELPIRMWTQDFKEKIVSIIKAEKAPSFIKDYDDYNTQRDVHFIIRMEEKYMKAALEEGLEEKFKLTKSIATSNLVAFDPEGRITKYATVEDIIKEFYGIRIKFYEKRKANLLAEMHKDLDKWSNQARFIQMIIDNKLVVSKRKKLDLIAELKQKGFKAIPKTADASKVDDLTPDPDNEEEADDVVTGANSYDYLLGMPIWSLTKERIDKLLKQIADREAEIDTLIKLTKEDLWNRDLDAFINEWRFQLEDEAKTRKKTAQMGRRASSKLKVDAKGPAARKRKAQGEDPDDSDFGNFAAAKKSAAVKRAPPRVGLLSHLSPLAKPLAKTKAATSKAKTQGVKVVSKKPDVQPSKKASEEGQSTQEASDDVWMNLDGTSQSKTEAAVAPIFQKAKAAAETKRPAPAKKVESDDEDEDIVRPAISRRPRAAAKKVPTYNLSDSDSNGDDLLFDVGKMVKGIDNTSADQSSNARTLFSASMYRPGSSAGLPKKSSSSARQTMDVDDDDTDYLKLAPQGSKRGASVTARSIIVSDDDKDDGDDDFSARLPSPTKALKAPRAPKAAAADAKITKPAASKATAPKTAASKSAKAKAPAVAAVKKTVQSSSQEPKKMLLSPAAKAYAAKKARNAARILEDDDEDDEVEKVVNEIMDEGEGSVSSDADDDDDPVVRRPARRAAAQAAVKGKKGWGLDSEDEEDESEDFEEDDSE